MYTTKNILSHTFRLALAILLTVLLLGLQPPGAAHAASFTAGTFAELTTAINTANGNGAADDITLTADIVLTGALPNITSNITINGAGFMLDGNSSFQVLRVTGGPVILNNITITNGIAVDSGGGIEIDGGTLTLNNSTVSNNTATSYGGGMIVENGSSLTINTSTISGNTANSGAGGGIADGSGTNTININNSTISDNTAPAGTGGGLDLFSSGTTTTLLNTIVANSATTALDCYRGAGTLTSQGYNLVENPDATCSFAATSDVTGSDPGLLALADNGGDTWTHAFDTVSPAHNQIPSGTNGCGTTYTTDQRGQPRPFEGTCDIGAFEGPLTPTTAPEIDVQGNGQSIPNGDTAPSIADDTDFGSVTLGGTPIPHTFTISNSGDADLNLTGTPAVTLTTSTHFSVTAQPTSPVISNSTTTFDITFDPSAAGSFTDTVNIANNDADENPYTFVISGTGTAVATAPEITVAPLSLAFGSQDVDAGPTLSQTVTITNDGTADLHISAVTPTGDTGEFNLADSGEITLTPGSTRTLEVSFDPSSAGAKAVTLTIQSDDADEPTVEVSLSGTGTSVTGQPGYGSTPAPGSSINVGTTSVGSTISATLTINETGEATLVVTPTLSGANAGDFGVAPTMLTILDGGTAQDLTISCTPSVTGTLAATLTVAHNASGSPAVYPLSCTGSTLRYIYLPLVLRNN